MRFLLFSVAIIATSIVLINGSAIPADADFEVFNDVWLVKQEDDDHVTYKRRQPISTTSTTTTTTTTTPAPTTRPPRPRTTRPPTRTAQTPLNAVGAGGRVPVATAPVVQQRRIGGLQPKSLSTRARTTTAAQNNLVQNQNQNEGNYFWMVSHRSDDTITYTRRNNDTQTQNQTTTQTTTGQRHGQVQGLGQRQGQVQGLGQKWSQGTLRSWGEGLDAVYARVVDTRSDERLTEESVQSSRRVKSGSRSQRPINLHETHTLNKIEERVSTEQDEYPRVGEEVNGWRVVAKTRDNISWERLREGEQVSSTAAPSSTLPVGGVQSAGASNLRLRNPTDAENRLLSRGSSTSSSSSSTSGDLESEDDGQPPFIGDEVGGWRVVSKSKNHIKWERVGVTTTSTTAAPALHLRSGDDYYDNYEDEEDQFPSEYDVYSKAIRPEEVGRVDDSEIRGIARSSNETNWKIGDELGGWKVVGRDYRGIIWEKCKNTTETPTTETPPPTTTSPPVLRSGSRLRLKSGGGIRPRPDSSLQLKSGDFVLYKKPSGEKVIYLRSRSNSTNNSNENGQLSNQEQRTNSNEQQKSSRVGWYLKEEGLNHITWQKDDVDHNAKWSFNDFPQVGHEQGGWQVANKSRSHISWRRVGRHESSEENSLESLH